MADPADINDDDVRFINERGSIFTSHGYDLTLWNVRVTSRERLKVLKALMCCETLQSTATDRKH